MRHRIINARTNTVESILASISDVMFPDALGERRVGLDSVGYEGDTPLHIVLWQEDAEAARILIEAGADINAIGDMGQTPLHIAVSRALAGAVTLLLAHGADPTIVSEFGVDARQLAAQLAVDAGTEIVSLLQQASP